VTGPLHYTAPPEPELPVTVSTVDADLAAAVERFLATTGCPAYLRAAAEPWLQARG